MVVSIILFYDKIGNIIIQDRRKISKHGEEFGFFGGHKENNETPKEVISRELKEELNLDINSLANFRFFQKFVFEKDGNKIERDVFLAEVEENFENTKSNEGKIYKTNFKEVYSLKMPFGDKEILKEIQKNLKLIEIFERVQKIPYQVCKYDEEDIDENLEKGDCRHKHFLLKKLLEQEGFEVKKVKVIFNWADLPIPKSILEILKTGTIWDHNSLKVKINDKWVKVDCTWNPELKEKGVPNTENWDGKSDTKQITEGKLEFFDKEDYDKYKNKIKISKEEAYKFAEELNKFLS